MNSTRSGARGLRRAVVVGATVAVAALLAGCAGGGASSTGAESDSIDYALPSNTTPNWILPINTAGTLNTNNLSISSAMWESLISYDGSSGSIAWNKEASIATDVVFADDGLSATITLGDRTWSDGEAITARDVEFWYNLVKNNKADWAQYSEGKVPDNFTSIVASDDSTVVVTFDQVYNQDWLLANQLSAITPLPQHAWDKTSADGAIGDYDQDAAGSAEVWDYLISEGEDLSSYATNELFTTVSGPYTLDAFTTDGKVTLVSNEDYDGGEAANISTVNLLPFTTLDAEENAVRSGSVDYGYISATNIDTFTDENYSIEPWSGWSITYMPYNFNNPTMGAVFQQLYARQAVQMSIDQESLSEVVWNGTATPGYGPVPQAQESDFVSETQLENPYPYDTDAAQQLLLDHGWVIGSDGVAVCEDAGTADTQCGEGVEAGTAFEMTVLSQSGSTVTDNMMAAIQSSLSTTGIKFDITTAPVNTVLSTAAQCESTDEACDWQLSFFGTGGSWYFNAYPTGESLFQTEGGSNFGNYSNPEIDTLVDNTTLSADPSAIQDYSAAVATDLPVIWLPSPDYQVSVVSTGLENVTQDSLAHFHPAQWKWSE